MEGGLQTALKGARSTPPPPLLGPGPLDFTSAIRELRPSDLNQPVTPSWPARLERWSAAAVPLWFAGVVLLSLRVSIGWVALERLRRAQIVPATAELTARVAALARPGEVLVSSTVKDLVAGSRLVFEDRGSHELKGIPGEWRLFAADRVSAGMS